MNFYEYLNIPANATNPEIKKAFRELAKATHPDYNKNENAFWEMVELNMVRDSLLNPSKRTEYDLMLQSGKSHTTHHNQPTPTKSKARSIFTHYCKVCKMEMRSTWKGYCLQHYLEKTNQADHPDNIFEYAGYTYQWVDPDSSLGVDEEEPNPKIAISMHPIYIAFYFGIIILLLGVLIAYILLLLPIK
ncbi:MAG: DnaJ domain-containing protein [bacterium]|nr:DnaJ domain-containing protein [bacterium]